MKKNLFDYGNENLEEMNNSDNYKNQSQQFNNNCNYNSSQNGNSNNTYQNSNNGFTSNASTNIQDEAKNLYDKYKNYSQDNLIQEFLTTSKQKLNDGSLTQDKINSTANALLPYLSDSQKELMKNLLEQLK